MEVGMTAAFPVTISTAMVSPTARPMPRTTPDAIPDIEEGITTLYIVCHLVAPRARLASRRVLGQFRMASSATVTMVGRAMMASTILPARPLSPTGSPNTCCRSGTMIISPKNPYTTEGMPFRSSITGLRKFLTFGEATSDM